MSKIQLTVTFDSLEELAAFAASRSAAPAQPLPRIAPDDLPDAGRYVGGGVAQCTSQPVKFGQQSAPASSPVAAPLAHTPAPSIAGAAAPSTVPAAPTSTTVMPPAPPALVQPPAPPAGVPSVPPAPPLASAPGVDVDKHGLPWDGRIHAETKGKNKDGSWRQRRNLPDGVQDTVEAELRQLMALNVSAGASPAPLAPSPPPLTAGVPVPPAPPAAPAPANPLGALLMKLAPLFEAGKLTPELADQAAQKHGLQNLSQLVLTPNLVPAVEADLLTLAA